MRLVVPTLALVLSIFPFSARADLILVEDNRFIEWNRDGKVKRAAPPGPLSWEWAAEELPEPYAGPSVPFGGPLVRQQTTFSGTTLTASGGAFVILDGGISQEAHSTFDVRFQVDRPTFVSLSGHFQDSNLWASASYPPGPLLFQEGSAPIFSWPSNGHEPFSFQTTLRPGAAYRLLIDASISEHVDNGSGLDLGHSWAFELEVPELPAVELLPLVLLVQLNHDGPWGVRRTARATRRQGRSAWREMRGHSGLEVNGVYMGKSDRVP